jgi:hypothetical protein
MDHETQIAFGVRMKAALADSDTIKAWFKINANVR